MKITQAEKAFTPITITLETRDEAVLLKNMIGKTSAMSRAELLEVCLSNPAVASVGNMYDELNRVLAQS